MRDKLTSVDSEVTVSTPFLRVGQSGVAHYAVTIESSPDAGYQIKVVAYGVGAKTPSITIQRKEPEA